ncbi:MAG: MobF family relaxase [Phormidesmis sp.]
MLSTANVSAAQAENYYEKDDYYTRGDPNQQSDSHWHGQGAQKLHLTGPVDKEIFQQLLHGQTPDGKSLHNRKIDPTKHRAGTDYTFSAPKSVSIAALIQKDKRVIAAHDNAVSVALNVLETRYAQTRIRRGPGIRERVTTGNIIAATFRHETSREQDPQLHTHCVVINATQLPNGKWQSISNDEALNNVKLLGEIYQNELAHQLQKLGYEIEPKGNGTFECKGYEKPLLDLFSTRSQQIENYIERWEAALKEQGGKPLHPKQKKQATLATRLRKKTVPREVLLEGWEKAISNSEIHLPAVPENHPEKTPEIAPDNTPTKPQAQALQSATEGIAHAAERESVFKREKAERFALEHHLGQQSFAELQTAMTTAGLVAAKDRFTTERAIFRELDTIAIMESGQNQASAISQPTDVLRLTQNETTLTVGQYKAILDTATSRDQFMAWQGVAGAGKTYSLNLLTQLATEQGYEVTGYAPSAQAANVLSEEAHIESSTVARLLHSKDTNRSSKKAIWIVDEAGLLSAKAAHALLTKAQANNARVILVGDTRQLSAVEAGNPFRSLQSAGMKTCYLEESRRQKTAALKTAVVCLAAGEPVEGLTQLERAGMVHEQKSEQQRHLSIVHDYISLPVETREKTLILSGTNVERLALTAELRKVLQQEGSLSPDSFMLSSLRSRDRTAAQLKYACAYELNDVVVPVKDYHRYGMQRREQYRVIAKDLENNRLTLQGPEGDSFSFDPATCADKTTYEVQQIPVARGEQLRWTRNEAVKGVRNGQLVTVEQVDAKGIATLTDASGKVTTLDLTGQQYLDYALVSTTYSSQGKTAEWVLATIDSTVSKEGLYVAVSRAKYGLSLYTADREKLYQKVQRSAAKKNPSDYLSLFNLVNPNAQSQKTAAATRDVRGADQSEYIGDCAGERVAVGHRAAVRRDLAAQDRGEQTTQRTARADRIAAGYVTDVRGVVTGIEERRAAAEQERQAERIGEAAEGIIECVEQLAATAAAVNRLHQELEPVSAAYRSGRERVAERRDRKRQYEAITSQIDTASPKQRDLLVAQRLIRDILSNRKGSKLSQPEVIEIFKVLTASPAAQRMKQEAGKDAATDYLTAVLEKVAMNVQRAIRCDRQRDRGMER